MKIEYKKERDILSLLYTYSEIHEGFFYLNDFILSQNQRGRPEQKLVILPTTETLDLLKSIKPHIRRPELKQYQKYKHFQVELEKYCKAKECKNSLTTAEKLMNNDFVQNLKLTLEPILMNINDLSIQIHISSYGTRSCFYYTEDEIHIYVRYDVVKHIRSIVSYVVISTLLSTKYALSESYTDKYPWNRLQYMIKAVMDLNTIQNLTENDSFALESQSLFTYEELIKSNQLYRYINSQILDNILITENIFINSKKIQNLTVNETKLLSFLIKNTNKICSYDDLANVLWEDGSYEKFSLQAITKTIERIKKSIKNNGIDREIIRNIRGSGYLFLN